MKGIAIRKLNRGFNAWELILGHELKADNVMAYSIKFESKIVNRKNRHMVDPESDGFPVTQIGDEEYVALEGLAECMKQMGILEPNDATKAELTATKYHLEDFRKLIFKKENK